MKSCDRTGPPPDVPECGFEGSLCESDSQVQSFKRQPGDNLTSPVISIIIIITSSTYIYFWMRDMLSGWPPSFPNIAWQPWSLWCFTVWSSHMLPIQIGHLTKKQQQQKLFWSAQIGRSIFGGISLWVVTKTTNKTYFCRLDRLNVMACFFMLSFTSTIAQATEVCLGRNGEKIHYWQQKKSIIVRCLWFFSASPWSLCLPSPSSPYSSFDITRSPILVVIVILVLLHLLLIVVLVVVMLALSVVSIFIFRRYKVTHARMEIGGQ